MTETDSVQSVHELLLFSLYGVGRSHIVTGDVTFLSGVDGTSLPPVAFPEEKSPLEIRNTRYRNKREEWTLKRKEKKTVGSKVSNDGKGTRLYCVSQTRLLSKSSYRGEVYKPYQAVVEGVFRFFTTRKVSISQCSKSESAAFKILLK